MRRATITEFQRCDIEVILTMKRRDFRAKGAVSQAVVVPIERIVVFEMDARAYLLKL